MKLPRRNFLHLTAGAAVLPAISRMSWAQAYPARPVTLIVFVPAGGTPDIIARLIGQSLSQRLGQSVVIDHCRRSRAPPPMATRSSWSPLRTPST
jgi:tripartite-type tricarboxylate transporter receptor subunit TctC